MDSKPGSRSSLVLFTMLGCAALGGCALAFARREYRSRWLGRLKGPVSPTRAGAEAADDEDRGQVAFI